MNEKERERERGETSCFSPNRVAKGNQRESTLSSSFSSYSLFCSIFCSPSCHRNLFSSTCVPWRTGKFMQSITDPAVRDLESGIADTERILPPKLPVASLSFSLFCASRPIPRVFPFAKYLSGFLSAGKHSRRR